MENMSISIRNCVNIEVPIFLVIYDTIIMISFSLKSQLLGKWFILLIMLAVSTYN